VTAGYYRNWYGNFGGGGYQVCGLCDVSLVKFTQVDNLVTQSSNYGQQKQINDFFNVSINTRFRSGIQLGGGIDTGRSTTDNSFVVDAPGVAAGTAAVRPHGFCDLPGHLRSQYRRRLHSEQRGNRAVARSQSRGMRRTGAVHSHRDCSARCAGHHVRPPNPAIGPALDEISSGQSAASAFRGTSTCTTRSTAAESCRSTTRSALSGASRPRCRIRAFSSSAPKSTSDADNRR
jgi:hypothetical protein